MRFSTYNYQGQTFYGAVTDEGLIPLSAHFLNWPTLRDVVRDGGLDQLAAKAETLEPVHQDVRFEIPIPSPEKIICVGVNFPDRNAEYKDGQAEATHMSLFPRFARSFTGHGQPLIRPPESDKLDYEGEIAVVIGKAGRRIPEADAYNHIAAITLCNEGTIRDWTRHAKFNVTQGKNWERSGAIGPWIVPFTKPDQLKDVEITTRVNGDVRQQDRTSRMLYPIPRQIAYISTFTKLVPGDVIVTGTPTGAGARLDPPVFLRPGDVVEVDAEGIGKLVNNIEDET
ncbi:MAG: fumarylacetoacetate hydrolase family protein [Pseudomonadota bacterium]